MIHKSKDIEGLRLPWPKLFVDKKSIKSSKNPNRKNPVNRKKSGKSLYGSDDFFSLHNDDDDDDENDAAAMEHNNNNDNLNAQDFLGFCMIFGGDEENIPPQWYIYAYLY